MWLVLQHVNVYIKEIRVRFSKNITPLSGFTLAHHPSRVDDPVREEYSSVLIVITLTLRSPKRITARDRSRGTVEYTATPIYLPGHIVCKRVKYIDKLPNAARTLRETRSVPSSPLLVPRTSRCLPRDYSLGRAFMK